MAGLEHHSWGEAAGLLSVQTVWDLGWYAWKVWIQYQIHQKDHEWLGKDGSAMDTVPGWGEGANRQEVQDPIQVGLQQVTMAENEPSCRLDSILERAYWQSDLGAAKTS